MNQLVTYDAMVAALFNAKPNHVMDGRMHAAIGIIGEVIEILGAHSPANLIEEFGDLEFYLEAYCQQADLIYRRGGIAQASMDYLLQSANNLTAHASQHEDTLLYAAGDLLDYTKKIWVYHKDPQPLEDGIVALLGKIHGALTALYTSMEITREQVLRLNQEKLAARFPDGVYTNYHAQARLDKTTDITSEGGTND